MGMGLRGRDSKRRPQREGNPHSCWATHEWGTQPPGQCTSDGEVYLDLSFIILILPFTSFFTNVIGIGSPIGKLTMAFVVG